MVAVILEVVCALALWATVAVLERAFGPSNGAW